MELTSHKKLYLVCIVGLALFFNAVIVYKLDQQALDTNVKAIEMHIKQIESQSVEVSKEEYQSALKSNKSIIESSFSALKAQQSILFIVILVNLSLLCVVCYSSWSESNKEDGETG